MFLALALPAGTAAPAEGIAWLSDVETARARSRAERKPIFAVFR
jgi:hypothetical protein